jgi:hypothetical protein
MSARDIEDWRVLAVIDRLCLESKLPAHAWDVQAALPAHPPKVVAAKLRKLVRRKLVTGCFCGCRGDFELTVAGREIRGTVDTLEDEP